MTLPKLSWWHVCLYWPLLPGGLALPFVCALFTHILKNVPYYNRHKKEMTQTKTVNDAYRKVLPLNLDSPIPGEKPFNRVKSRKPWRDSFGICRDVGGKGFWSWTRCLALPTAAPLLLSVSSIAPGLLLIMIPQVWTIPVRDRAKYSAVQQDSWTGLDRRLPVFNWTGSVWTGSCRRHGGVIRFSQPHPLSLAGVSR
jgi:hypothetical protein